MTRLVPLGDQAVLAYCATEEAAVALASAVRSKDPAWLVDVVPAYLSVAVFFDSNQATIATVRDFILNVKPDAAASRVGKEIVVGCCYDMGPDLERVAQFKNISVDDVIRLHTSKTYTVYAVGFCPGFPYLGYLPDDLAGVPRLDSPRLRVEPGSVGLTGRQTGIYPVPRPGGWNLIGRTPLQLVDLESGYFALAPGDRVRFEPISPKEYQKQLGQRAT
jgi:inhibitor of KinA